MLQELVIKVPAPFAGTADIGFSTRYPAQPAQAPLRDELFILAFRDESLNSTGDEPLTEQRYVANLVRPLVFPFLKDCVRIGELALRDSILLALLDDTRVMAEIELQRSQIVPRNGSIVLDSGVTG